MFCCIRTLKFQTRDFIALLVAMICLLFGVLEWWYLPLTPSLEIEVSNPYFTTMDQQGNCYIINDGKSEILKVNPQGEICARMSCNTHEEDTFGEADEVAVDTKGNIYVLDILWNDTGLGLSGERVLRYDSEGHFKEVVFETDYSDCMVMKRHCFSLRQLGDEIVFASVDAKKDQFMLYRIESGSDEANLECSVAWERAEEIQDISIVNKEQIMVVNKRGEIFRTDTVNATIVFEKKEKEYILPFFITGIGEDVYFSDICNQEIYQIENQKVDKLYTSERLEKITGISMSDTILETVQACSVGDNRYLCMTCADGVSVIDIQTDECREYTSIPYVKQFQALFILRVVAFVLAGLIFAYYLMVMIRYLIMSGVLGKKKFSIILIVGVSLSALFVMSTMLKSFKNNYVEEQIGNMCTVTQIASSIIDPEALKQVNYPADYGNDAYQKLQETMTELIDVSSPYSENLYCNIVKLVDDRCYALGYLDNSIGAYYPLDQGEVEEAHIVYETGETYINDGKSDATGSYVYVKTPIKDSGDNVVGIVEIGMVSDTLTYMVDSLRLSIVVEIVLMVIIAVFILNEVLAFAEDHKEWKRKKETEGKAVFPVSYLRVITFFCFVAYNMPTSFLPVYVEKFYDDSLPFSVELAGSLPLTVNFAMIGIMSVFCAGLLRKIGFRYIMMIGSALCMAGDLSLAMASDYWMAAGGLFLNGVGCGLLMNGLSIIVANQDSEGQSKGFSVINGAILSGMISGTVIGATIAENLGASRMFFVSTVIWGCICVMMFWIGKNFVMRPQSGVKKTENVLSAVFSNNILGYLILVVIPYTMVNGFTCYFLPIYADAYGLGESQTSLLLVMNCLVGIFLSGALTDVCRKYLGRASIVLSSVLSLGAILIFGYFENLYMLAFALFVLGVAKSFGSTTRELFFCEQPKVQQIGEDKAMGYYNLADNLGESLGTMVFGGIMSIGFLSGMWMLTGASAAMMGIYEILGRKFRKKS